MVSLLSSRSRSIDLLAWYVIILFFWSITAFGQTPQLVLGTSQVQASLDTDNTQMGEAFPVTATSSAQINSLSLFIDDSNSAATVFVGLYSSFYGHPNTLLSQAALTRPVSGRWNSVNIPSVRVKQGRRYWVALLGLNGQIAFRDNTGDCYSETSQQTALTSLPPTWRTGSRWSTCVVSMFGTALSDTSVSVTVSPTRAFMRGAQQQQFAATISGTTNTAVTWKATGGTVTSGGLYTAPSSVGTYTITATSAADSTKSSFAVVTVLQLTQLSISVSPSALSLLTGAQKQFTASVSGSSNTAVSWAASGGTVTSGGLYTAPSSAGTYTVIASSAADPTKSASAIITVSQPTQVAITLSPNAVSLPSGGQQQFISYVSGTANSAVTWSATGGTVTSGGLYVAPSTAGNYAILAVSVADPTKSASAAVSVSAPQAISVSISPTAIAMPQQWQQQFAAKVSGSTNNAVVWSVKQGTGTITQAGLYTAPPAAETDVIAVTSQADSTKSASANVTVVPPHLVSLGWSAPTSPGISYYKVYRGTVSGGPYSVLSNRVTVTSYTDSSVQSGSTYYYVTTAVDTSGMESAYSGVAQAVIPMP
jgi:hypothetical protein